VLFRRGDPSDGGYVVRSGAITLDAEDGASAPFVAGPGSLIGQAALFATVDRPATAIALEPAAVLRVSPNLMRRVLEEFPAAAFAIQELLAGELAQLTQGLERVRQTLVAIDREERSRSL
jgi:CRP-like cAMP-binding protein